MSSSRARLDPPHADDGPQAQTPFTLRRRMHWGDSDPAQIGYTTTQINYGLEAAECWWEAVLGCDWLQLRRAGYGGVPVVALSAAFRRPVQPGDRIDLKVFVARLGDSSLDLRVEGYRVGHEEAEPHFTITLTEVMIVEEAPMQIRATPFTGEMRARIEGYQRDCAHAADGGASIEQVLDFWFGPPGDPGRGRRREIWWQSTPELDAEIRARFEVTWTRAAAGDLDHWALSPRGALALLIVLDQFPRNMFRKSARAFASDAKAREIADAAIAAGHDKGWPLAVGSFFYLPFEHSEDLADQERCLDLFAAFAGEDDYETTLAFVREHRDLIARFGDLPKLLGALSDGK